MSTTRYKAKLAIQPSLFASASPRVVTTFSAPNRGIHDQEQRYLCAWLRSRLEDGTWTLRDESALTATARDRAQVTRLALQARALHLPVWPARQGRAA